VFACAGWLLCWGSVEVELELEHERGLDGLGGGGVDCITSHDGLVHVAVAVAVAVVEADVCSKPARNNDWRTAYMHRVSVNTRAVPWIL
jgi:hypothetical protein